MVGANWRGAAAVVFSRAWRGYVRSQRDVMANNRTALSLAFAATILLTLSACSDSPIAPAPVYLMGRTTGGPGGLAAATPISPPSHLPIAAAAPSPAIIQLQSPSHHQDSQPAIRESRTTFVQKNHRHQVAMKLAARRRAYDAAHAPSVPANSSSPQQIPLDEPIMAPAPSAAAPASKAPSSQQPKTSWVSPAPDKDP